MRGLDRYLVLSLSNLAMSALVGCSPESRVVGGKMDLSYFEGNGADVVAISSQGLVYRTSLDAAGAFQAELPVGSIYELRFVRPTSLTTRYEEFAFLTHPTLSGLRKQTFTLDSGAAVELGVIRPRGADRRFATAAAQTSAVTSDEELIDVCETTEPIVEVESETNFLRLSDSDDDGVSDADDPDVAQSCRPARDASGHRLPRCRSNNGHGNNTDGVDSSNPGRGHGGPNSREDPSGEVDDENGSKRDDDAECLDENEIDEDVDAPCAPVDELPPDTCPAPSACNDSSDCDFGFECYDGVCRGF